MAIQVFAYVTACRCAPVGVVLLIDRGVLPSVLEEEMVR
jgi:hypothetical protein